MPTRSTDGRLRGQPRPREFLSAAEDRAVEIRKLLHLAHQRQLGEDNPESMGDALALADLIETLARYGQNVSAEEAVEIAGRVELLIDLLLTEINSLSLRLDAISR